MSKYNLYVKENVTSEGMDPTIYDPAQKQSQVLVENEVVDDLVTVSTVRPISSKQVIQLADRVETLEEIYNEYEIYENIESGTHGSVTIPEGATIRLGQYVDGQDCLIAQTDEEGKPIDNIARASDGTGITATLDQAGNYTLSQEPEGFPVSIIFQVQIQGKDVGNIDLDSILGWTAFSNTDSVENRSAVDGNTLTEALELIDSAVQAATIEYNNIFFVSKSGDDENTGKTESEAFLTIGKALEEAESNDLIKVIGSETWEENIIIGERIYIDACNATLAGTVQIGNCAVVKLNRLRASDDNTTLIRNVGCTGRSHIIVNQIRGASHLDYTGTRIVQNLSTEGSIILTAGYVEVSEDGYFIYSLESGGELELTAPSNEWTGTNVDSGTDSNVWVNSAISATCQFGNIDDPPVYGPTIDDPNARTLTYTFSSGTEVTDIDFVLHTGWIVGRSSAEFKVFGSNDGITYDELLHEINPTWQEGVNRFELDTSGTYTIYTLLFLASNDLHERTTIAQIQLINNDEQVGGNIEYNIQRMVVDENATVIKASSDTCDYNGYINEITDNGNNATFVDIAKGVVSILGNKAHLDTLYNKTGGTLHFNYPNAIGTKIGNADTDYFELDKLRNWEAERAYKKDQTIVHDLKQYRVVNDYTSALIFQDDIDNGDLERVVGAINHNDLDNRDVAGNHAMLIPIADSTTAIQIMKADGVTEVVTVGTTISPKVDIYASLNVFGNITQEGNHYETHLEHLYTKNDLIITRDEAIAGLNIDEYTGIQAKLYDGTNDGQLVFDKDGWARVGDIGDLQKIATIQETPDNGGVGFYSAGDFHLKTDAGFTWDNTNKILGIGATTGKLLAPTTLELGTDTTTALTIDSSQQVLVGSGTSSYPFEISQNSGVSLGLTITDIPSTDSGLGSIHSSGYSVGTTKVEGARIQFLGDGSWSATSAPTRIAFFTTTADSTSITERMVIKSDGSIGVGMTDPEEGAGFLTARRLFVKGATGLGQPSIYTSPTSARDIAYFANNNSAMRIYGENDRDLPNRFYFFCGGDEVLRLEKEDKKTIMHGDATVAGDFDVTGTKNFYIQHPLYEDKMLRHACIEAPEVIVFYRGTARLNNGEATITLPDYFEALTEEENRTVQLTHIDGFDLIAVKKQDGKQVKDGTFIVYSNNEESSQEFNWEVKARRKLDKPFEVVSDKPEQEIGVTE